jgi:membrane carboxypeptidase/penicillin-binding protein
MSYMAKALQGQPDEPLVPPEGVIGASINPETGLRNERASNRVQEYFLQENVPGEEDGTPADGSRKPRTDDVDDQLY